MKNNIKLKMCIVFFCVIVLNGCSLTGLTLSSSIDDELHQNNWEKINNEIPRGV